MLTEKNTIVYDIEIQNEVKDVKGGWENPEAMKMASAVTYDFATDSYDFFLGDKGQAFLLKKLHNRTVVGFNSVQFDSRVILGNNRQMLFDHPIKIGTTVQNSKEKQVLGEPIFFENIDLALLYVNARFFDNAMDMSTVAKVMSDFNIHDGTWSLDALAKTNLGQSKNGHGALAPGLWQAGRIDKLFSYNFNDVRMTRDLFLYILDTGILKDSAGRIYPMFLK